MKCPKCGGPAGYVCQEIGPHKTGKNVAFGNPDYINGVNVQPMRNHYTGSPTQGEGGHGLSIADANIKLEGVQNNPLRRCKNKLCGHEWTI